MAIKTTQTSPNGDARTKSRVRENEPAERPVCHYLGLSDDPETWLAFPSPGNYCHFVEKPAAIAPEYQQACCLTDNHFSCPVFELKNRNRLPATIALYGPRTIRRRQAGRILTLMLLVIIVLTGITLFVTRQSITAFTIFPVTNSRTATPRPESTMNSQATMAPTVAPIVIADTETPLSTSTTTSTTTATNTPTVTATPTIFNNATFSPTATPIEPSLTPIPTVDLPQILVNVAILNVRSGPGVDYPIIATIDQNTRYNITGQNLNQDWWLICCLDEAGTTGWVFSESVDVEGLVDNVPVADSVSPPPTEIP